jgi:hypothetical protein
MGPRLNVKLNRLLEIPAGECSTWPVVYFLDPYGLLVFVDSARKTNVFKRKLTCLIHAFIE